MVGVARDPEFWGQIVFYLFSDPAHTVFNCNFLQFIKKVHL